MSDDLRIPAHWEHRDDGTWVAGAFIHWAPSKGVRPVPRIVRPGDSLWEFATSKSLPQLSRLHIGWRGEDFVARDPKTGAEEIVPLEDMLATVDDVAAGREALEPMYRVLGERFELSAGVVRKLSEIQSELGRRAGELRQRAEIRAEVDEAGDIVLRRDGEELVRAALAEWNFGVSPVNRLGRVLKARGFELDLATRKRLVAEVNGRDADPLEAAQHRVRRAELHLERAQRDLQELQTA